MLPKQQPNSETPCQHCTRKECADCWHQAPVAEPDTDGDIDADVAEAALRDAEMILDAADLYARITAAASFRVYAGRGAFSRRAFFQAANQFAKN